MSSMPAVFILGMIPLVGLCLLIAGPLLQIAGVLTPFILLGVRP